MESKPCWGWCPLNVVNTKAWTNRQNLYSVTSFDHTRPNWCVWLVLPHYKPIIYPEQDKAWPCVLKHTKNHSSSSSAGWIGASCRSLAAFAGFWVIHSRRVMAIGSDTTFERSNVSNRSWSRALVYHTASQFSPHQTKMIEAGILEFPRHQFPPVKTPQCGISKCNCTQPPCRVHLKLDMFLFVNLKIRSFQDN